MDELKKLNYNTIDRTIVDDLIERLQGMIKSNNKGRCPFDLRKGKCYDFWYNGFCAKGSHLNGVCGQYKHLQNPLKKRQKQQNNALQQYGHQNNWNNHYEQPPHQNNWNGRQNEWNAPQNNPNAMGQNKNNRNNKRR